MNVNGSKSQKMNGIIKNRGRTVVQNEANEGVMTSFVNGSIACGTLHGLACGTLHGLACGCLCVLRQRFNRLYQSCPIIKNMFMKVEAKEIIVSFVADILF